MKGLLPSEPEAVTASSGPATVVVARRVVHGHEAEFERWVRRIHRAVRRAPGFVRAEFDPPGPHHRGEWVTVFQFADAFALERWLSCEERRTLLQEGRALLASPPHEQRIVEPGADSVTLVSSIRLRPGNETKYRSLYDGAVDTARELGGLLRAELLPAIPGAQPETIVLMTFRARNDLERWLHCEERRRTLEAMDALADSERTVNVVGGFAGWLHTAGGLEPKRWKQASAVFLGLLPVAIVTRLACDLVASDMHWLPAVAIAALANVVILTWLVMPSLTRRLQKWLIQ